MNKIIPFFFVVAFTTPVVDASVVSSWKTPQESIVHAWTEVADAGRQSVWVLARANTKPAFEQAMSKFPPGSDIHSAVFSLDSRGGRHHRPLPHCPTPNPVPLPAASWLFVSGVLGMVGISVRNKKNLLAT